MNDQLDALREISPGLTKWFVDFVDDLLTKALLATRLRTKQGYLRTALQKLDQLTDTSAASNPDVLAFAPKVAVIKQQIQTLETQQAEQLAAGEAFAEMPLARQCATLGIPLETLELEKSRAGWIVDDVAYKKPEPAAFAHYKLQGYDGTKVEGTGPLSLMKCACYSFLFENNPVGKHTDTCLRYFEAQCEIHWKMRDELISHIRAATDAAVERHARRFLRVSAREDGHPEMHLEGLMAIWHATGGEALARYAEIFVQDPYGFRSGWPDLALAKEGQLHFVEVKTTDRLLTSQRDTIRDLLLPVGASVSVLQLVAKRNRD